MKGRKEIRPIAFIRNAFDGKFGIPRQSGLVETLTADIVFEPEFRDPQALRGIEGFSHLWLIWEFSEAVRAEWSPTVRPPRLGGNTRVGVFATRSPFRPNALGLSSVRLEAVIPDKKDGTVLRVSGADLMNGTPIYDVKPYLAYTDSHPDAVDGFAGQVDFPELTVDFPAELLCRLPESLRKSLPAVLAQDPRPSYQKDSGRIYGFGFGGYEIRFRVAEQILTVLSVEPNG